MVNNNNLSPVNQPGPLALTQAAKGLVRIFFLCVACPVMVLAWAAIVRQYLPVQDLILQNTHLLLAHFYGFMHKLLAGTITAQVTRRRLGSFWQPCSFFFLSLFFLPNDFINGNLSTVAKTCICQRCLVNYQKCFCCPGNISITTMCLYDIIYSNIVQKKKISVRRKWRWEEVLSQKTNIWLLSKLQQT